jgi:hypothetical protein
VAAVEREIRDHGRRHRQPGTPGRRRLTWTSCSRPGISPSTTRT